MNTSNNTEILKTKLSIACRHIRSLTSFQNFPAAPSVNLLLARDVAGYSPIHHAAVSGNIELTTLLANLFHWLKLPVTAIDARDRTGSTALQWAIRKGHGLVLQTLVDYGAILMSRIIKGVLRCIWQFRRLKNVAALTSVGFVLI